VLFAHRLAAVKIAQIWSLRLLCFISAFSMHIHAFSSAKSNGVCESVIVAYTVCWRCEFSRCEVPVHSCPHACSYIWLTQLGYTDRHILSTSSSFLPWNSSLFQSSYLFLPRCDHTSPSLPQPSFPLTLSSSVPLPSLTLTVTSRLRWHLISISLPPQTCNICSPLFLRSPLLSRVLPVSASPLREHAACVIFCTVTLLCQQPRRNLHQSQETFLPQMEKK